MRRLGYILLAALTVVSCDLLYNIDSDSEALVKDISISAIEAIPTAAKVGEVITVDVTAKNTGTSNVGEQIEIILSSHTDGATIGKATLPDGLARNDSVTISYSWDTGNLSVGEYTLVAKHIFEDNNAANDSLKSTVTVSEPDITDIAVSEVRLPDTIEEGEVVDVEVDVKNIGNQDVNETITIDLNDLTDGKTIGTQKVEGGLVKGDSTTFTFSWDTQGYSIGDHQLSASHDFTDENTSNNNRTTEIIINEAPVTDIAITSIDVPSEATQGDDVEVSVTVRNVGNKDTEADFAVILTDQTDDKQIASKNISGLDAENTVVLTFVWDTDEASIGDHQLSASHDFTDENTANDTQTASVTINEAPITDIAITSIEAPSEATQGDNVELKVNIENQGNQDIDEAITITLIDQNDGATIDSKSISGGFLAGASEVITLNWNTSTASTGNHILVASHSLEDDNADNNSKSVEITINKRIFLDIAFTGIEAPDEAERGDIIAIEVTIQNQGNRDVNEDIRVTLVDQTEDNTIGTQTLWGGMEKDASETLRFLWFTIGAKKGDHKLVVSHDYSDDDMSNNSRSVIVEIEND